MAIDFAGLTKFISDLPDAEFMKLAKAVQDEAQHRRVAIHVTEVTGRITKAKQPKTSANKSRVRL